jgi:hypothetical protein
MKKSTSGKVGRPKMGAKRKSEWLTIPIRLADIELLDKQARETGQSRANMAREDVLDGIYWRENN